MLITTLAWISVRMSVTLAALVTVAFLPMAILRVRQSVSFAMMTLAMLGMMWRGETWKYQCLRLAGQLSQSLPQSRQLSPKRAFSRSISSIGNGDLLPTDGPLIFAAAHVHFPQHYAPCETEAYLEIPRAVRPCILESCSDLAESSSVEHHYDNLRLSSLSANRHQHLMILYDIYCLML